MQKTKTRIFLVALVIFSMVTSYLTMPMARAASFDSAKDTISDSTPGAVATHTIAIDMGTALVAGNYVSIDFGSFTGAVEGGVNCTAFGASTASTTPGGEVGCVATGAVASTSVQTITVSGVTSPAAGGYSVYVRTYLANGTEIENAQTIVYLVDAVTVTAHVNATLTFGVAAVNAGTTINGQVTTATSTATSTPFGTLAPDTDVIVGQRLSVSTNASDGFVVTVQQDDEMTSAAGSNINSFNNAANDSGTIVPEVWANPVGTLGSDNTYGHMGLTSDDGVIGGIDFTGAKFAGLSGTNALAVMSHNGPANSATTGIGTTDIAYRARISALQEAGDYTSTLTYICTPTY